MEVQVVTTEMKGLTKRYSYRKLFFYLLKLLIPTLRAVKKWTGQRVGPKAHIFRPDRV